MKTRIVLLLLTAALIMAGTSPLYSQNAEQLYQKALIKEEGEGNLPEAIEIFNSIVEDSDADQSLQAKALLHVGLCYEKLGKEEATKAYQKLVNNFPAQKNEVAIARERLSRLILAVEKLAQKEDSKDLVIRKFMEGTGSEFYGAPSPDGKYFAFVDYKTFPNDIIIKDIETENEIRLKNQVNLNHDGDKGTLYNPIWSPDSKQIAYVWENDKDNFYKLLVINVKSPKPKILFRVNYNNGWIKTEDWSPDGQKILVQLTQNNLDQLGLVSVINGSFQQLKKIGKTAPYSAKFSPDGKFVAFDNPPNEENTEHDIFVIQIDDKKETKITSHPSHDYFLDWSSSGEKILFASDRTGTTDMWSISFSGGSGQKTPELVSENIGNIKALGTTNEGSFYYSTPGSWWDIFSTTINPESGKVIEPPKEIPLPYQGFNRHPVWSPDGKYLAYVSVRRHLRKPNILCIYIKETGEVKEFSFKNDVTRPVWFPDSRSVLLFNTEVLNLESGEITKTIQLNKDEELEKFAINISSDGKYIYYETRNKNWDKHSIVRFDLESSEEKELYMSSDDNITMALSPDNKQLALLQRHNKNTRILKIVSVTDSSEKIIHTFKQDDFGYVDLTWSPNGKYICFSKKADSDWVLFRIPAIGGVAENLDVHKNLFTSISIHPNGQLIAFSSFVGKEKPGGIWVMENFLPLEKLAQNEETEAAKEPEGIVIKQLPDLLGEVSFGSPSLDANFFSYMDGETGNLAIRNLKTEEKRNLTKEGTWDDPMQFANFSKISPDNKWVAYSWQYVDKGNKFDLRIVNVNDPSPRILYDMKDGEVHPAFWLSDNKRLIAYTINTQNSTYQIISVNTDDGSFNVLNTFKKINGIPNLCLSTDEKYIAFDFPNGTNINFDIYSIPVEGGPEIPLVEHPANDRTLGWLPGRKELLFLSDRSGTWDIWSLPVAKGKPKGQPKLIFSDAGEIKPVGITRDGSLYFSKFGRKFTTTITPFDANEGNIKEKSGRPLLGSIYNADWSPDGKSMVYIKETPAIVGYDEEIHVLDFKTGKEHQITENLATIIPVSWSPTENTILAFAPDLRKISEKNYLGGIYKIDAKTGQETEILSFSRDSFKDLSLLINSAIEWSLDGKSIFYFKDNQILKRDTETGHQNLFYQAQNTIKCLKRSPIANKLVFVDGQKLMIANVDDGHINELNSLENNLKITNIAWSHDGSFIYINTGKSLLRLPANGGTIQKIHQFKKGNRYVSFSPDGQKIAFSEYEQINEIRKMENLNNKVEKIYSQNE